MLVELQTYLSSLDKRGVLVLKDCYRSDYFQYVMREVENHSGKIFIAVSGDKAVGLVVCKIFQGGGEAEITTCCQKIGFIIDVVETEDQWDTAFAQICFPLRKHILKKMIADTFNQRPLRRTNRQGVYMKSSASASTATMCQKR